MRLRAKHASKIKTMYKLPVQVEKVQKFLLNIEYLEWRKMESSQVVKPHDPITKVIFALCCQKIVL